MNSFKPPRLTWASIRELAKRERSFLVPYDVLFNYLEKYRQDIEKFIKSSPSDEVHEMAIDKISWKLCAEFGVSNKVIETRINKENMWEDLGFYTQ